MKIEIVNSKSNIDCFFCKNLKTSLKIKITDAPLVLGCTSKTKNNDDLISYNVYQCQHCNLVFTDANLDEMAYSQVHSEAVGKIWKEHHKLFSEFVNSKENRQTLEIGPSNNPISRKNTTFVDMFEEIPFTLLENENYVKGRFPDVRLKGKFNRIIASHVFEHSTNPEQFLLKCLEILDDDGEIFLSIPNFEFWINQKYWNGITAEHQIYPSVDQIKQICNKLELNLKFEFFQNHSVFLRLNAYIKYQNEDSTHMIDVVRWAESIKSSIKTLEDYILKNNIKEIFIAGASHISQYPIMMSESIRRITNYTLDNSISKHEKRLYGTSCVCKPFEYLSTVKNPTVVLFNSPYRKEMIEQIKFVNKNSNIIEC